jgi:hypothetical protein
VCVVAGARECIPTSTTSMRMTLGQTTSLLLLCCVFSDNDLWPPTHMLSNAK